MPPRWGSGWYWETILQRCRASGAHHSWSQHFHEATSGKASAGILLRLSPTLALPQPQLPARCQWMRLEPMSELIGPTWPQHYAAINMAGGAAAEFYSPALAVSPGRGAISVEPHRNSFTSSGRSGIFEERRHTARLFTASHLTQSCNRRACASRARGACWPSWRRRR
jgi:hypothetical protein